MKFSECLYGKKVDPFARAKIDCAFSDSPALNELWRLDKPEKGDLTRQVNLLAKPFFSSCRQFAKLFKEM